MNLAKTRGKSPFIRYWFGLALLLLSVSLSGLIWYSPDSPPPEQRSIDSAEHDIIDAERDFPDVSPAYGVLPGEFENHDGLLIGSPVEIPPDAPPRAVKLRRYANQTLFEVIANTPPDLQILVAAPSIQDKRRILAQFTQAKLPIDRIHVIVTEIETNWVRDFAPYSMRHDRMTWIATIFDPLLQERTADAAMAWSFSTRCDVAPVRSQLALDGGNLITNGEGLFLTTKFTLDLNRRRGFWKRDVSRLLRHDLGAKQIVYLDSLSGDMNRHVDMFLTMPAPDTIVLAEFSAEQDPRNHEILEQNYRRLQSLRRNGQPLKILRVPMPPRGSNITFGGTYTNVVYANGVLFVPRFEGVDEAGHAKALEVYRQILPDWKIVSIESSAWIAMNGSLHCLTKNLFNLPPAFLSRSRLQSRTAQLDPSRTACE